MIASPVETDDEDKDGRESMKCTCGNNMNVFETMPTRYECDQCHNECQVRDDGAHVWTNAKGERFTPSFDLDLNLIERIEAQLSSAD